jgi:alpha-tubulin suppressor-like RCC1 family protein
LSPTQPSVSFAAVDVSAGRSHVLALAKDGTVYAWGDGSYGRLGIGEMPVVRIRTNAPRTMREVLYPIQIPELTGVTAVSAGREHSLALLADGTVQAWGRNHRGQLGDGTTVDRTTPVVVAGVRNAVAVGAGSSISAALLADGSLMTWGSNENGQLGRTGSNANPIPAIVPGVVDIRTIAIGDSHVLALTKSGTVISWGDDQFGATGKNRVKSAVPTVIPGLNGVAAVYAKDARSAAVLGDGSVRIWGYVPPFPRPIGDVIFSPIPIELLLNPADK